MRGGGERSLALSSSAAPGGQRSDWRTLRRLLPYLWQYKGRVLAAIAFMVGAKLANVGVPLLLKQLVDAMTLPAGGTAALLVVPVGLLLAYGALRLANSVFNELRELVFAKATHGAARAIALKTFARPLLTLVKRNQPPPMSATLNSCAALPLQLACWMLAPSLVAAQATSTHLPLLTFWIW